MRSSLVAVALLFSAWVAQQTQNQATAHYNQTQRYQDLYYLPPPEWLQVASLGYREATAAMVWIAALVNFGQELQHRGPVRYFYQYADAVLSLDPNFRRVYTWAGTLALYRPKEATLADARRAIDYLKRAHQRFPQDGEIAWQLGATYFYELPSLLRTPEERLRAQQEGVDFLKAAALLGGGPSWAGLNAASALTRLGRREQAVRHLMEIYTTLSDPVAKREIEARILQLRGQNVLEGMRQADRQLQQDRQQQYPYLSTDLYLLIGPRPAFSGLQQLIRDFDPQPDPDWATDVPDSLPGSPSRQVRPAPATARASQSLR